MAEPLTAEDLLAPTPELHPFTGEQLAGIRDDPIAQRMLQGGFPHLFSGASTVHSSPVAERVRDVNTATAVPAVPAVPAATTVVTAAKHNQATAVRVRGSGTDVTPAKQQKRALAAPTLARVQDVDTTAASSLPPIKRTCEELTRGVPATAFGVALAQLDETFSELQKKATAFKTALESNSAKSQEISREISAIESTEGFARHAAVAAKADELRRAEAKVATLKAALEKARAAAPGEDLFEKALAAKEARGGLIAESAQLEKTLEAVTADLDRGKFRGEILNMSGKRIKGLLHGLCASLPAEVTGDAADEVAVLVGAMPLLSLPVFRRVRFDDQRLAELDARLLANNYLTAHSAAQLKDMACVALSPEDAALVEQHAADFMQSRAWHAKEAARFLAQKQYEVTDETRAAAARLVALAPLAPGERVIDSEAAKKRKMLFGFAAQCAPATRAIVDIMTAFQSDSIVLFDGGIIPVDPWGEWIVGL